MTKDQFTLKIALAMHNTPHAGIGLMNAYLESYESLSSYFKDLSLDDIT